MVDKKPSTSGNPPVSVHIVDLIEIEPAPQIRKFKLPCPRENCQDPHCDRAHAPICDRCGRSIDEQALVMTGRHSDVPMHEDCACARYGE